MTAKKYHFSSGLIITAFVGPRLFSYFRGIFGAEKHIEVMNMLRYFYRNVFKSHFTGCYANSS
jgi:hypothetical protein